MPCEFAPFCLRLTHPTACLTSQPRQKGAAHSSTCTCSSLPAMLGRTLEDTTNGQPQRSTSPQRHKDRKARHRHGWGQTQSGRTCGSTESGPPMSRALVERTREPQGIITPHPTLSPRVGGEEKERGAPVLRGLRREERMPRRDFATPGLPSGLPQRAQGEPHPNHEGPSKHLDPGGAGGFLAVPPSLGPRNADGSWTRKPDPFVSLVTGKASVVRAGPACAAGAAGRGLPVLAPRRLGPGTPHARLETGSRRFRVPLRPPRLGGEQVQRRRSPFCGLILGVRRVLRGGMSELNKESR